MHDRYEPIWFFAPILLLGVTPWVGFIPNALTSLFGIRRINNEHEKRVLIYLYLWISIIFVFFSLSGSKLIPYILPVLPPIAVIFASFMNKILVDEDLLLAKRVFKWGAPIFILVFIASIVYPFFDDNEIGDLKLYSYTIPFGLISLAFPFIGKYSIKKANVKLFVFGMLTLSLLFTVTAKRGFTLMGETRSTYDTALLISEHKREGDLVAQIWDYDQGLPFYLKQRIVLIDWLGELEFGASQEKEAMWFLEADEIKEFWDESERVFFIVSKKNVYRFESLLKSNDIVIPGLLGENNRNAIYLKP